ncbi:thioredoxin domain-containing protein [Parablastomonas sp. CN1-191]|uniref:thioredoxin domain-containing protein n=1 Tax=Parablastomonas sp. CN1-191 TaxID=3400908 RepID=UPI003BF7E635
MPTKFLIAPLLLAVALISACKQDGPAATGAPGGAQTAPIAPPAGKAWADMIVKTPEGGYRMGNPDAPIKLVEFGSLTCPHCAEFTELGAADIRDKYVASGRVSYEFRNFVRDPLDITATMLVQCAPPESFFALTDQVFANQSAMYDKIQAAGEAAQKAIGEGPPAQRFIGYANLAGLTDFFSARGLAKPQAEACLSNVAKAQAFADATEKDAATYDIQGTPTFLLNGSKIEANTWPGIKAELERAGAR